MGFIESLKHRRPKALSLLGFCIFLAAGCKKSAVSPSTESPAAGVQLTMPAPRPSVSATSGISESTPGAAKRDAESYRYIDERLASDPAGKEAMLRTAHELNARSDAREKLLAINHEMMVIPAPANFRPEPVARKIRLRLTLENTIIHQGQRLRFRLEMTNVGREAIVYSPLDASIFRSGSLLHTRNIHFMITNFQKEKSELQAPLPLDSSRPTEIAYPNGVTDAEKESLAEEANARSEAGSDFEVKLMPGETLRSLGDGDSARAPYRTLVTARDNPFDKPGTYQLQVELDDRPSALTKAFIDASVRSGTSLEDLQKSQEREMKDALGPVSSNPVNFQVTR